MLRQAGATTTPLGYELNNRSIRVVNGAASVLSKLKARFIEAPTVAPTDVVVAVGAIDLPVPTNVVRPGQAGNFIRPAVLAEWFDMEGARAELGI